MWSRVEPLGSRSMDVLPSYSASRNHQRGTSRAPDSKSIEGKRASSKRRKSKKSGAAQTARRSSQPTPICSPTGSQAEFFGSFYNNPRSMAKLRNGCRIDPK